MSARSIAFGVWFARRPGDLGGREDRPVAVGERRVASSQPSWVEPLGPEWPSCMQILASVSAWTKSTMRFQPASCSRRVECRGSRGVMRPSGVTQVISV